ncbi:MAG: T9SS type A sorting domain-containing protein [Bacteroidia bacterium]
MKRILLLNFIFFNLVGWSQPILKRNGNSTLLLYNSTHPRWNVSSKLNKWGKRDTLKMPFFDDFVSTRVYPDSSRWFNNFVFVNNDFAVNPPSYGVATFDDLDNKGNPYQELNDQTFGACDTLLSLAINLKDSSSKFYTPADSIYFSFYYQRQGIGDASDSRDSLILQFKDTGGIWKTQFKAIGGNVSPFTFVIIGINNSKYLIRDFQFRFINFARHTGNMNQWHVDYIHLARNRKKAVNFYDDIAIQSQPTSLLKKFFQMPYDHYQADSANQKAKLIFVNASNLHNVTRVVQARQIESNNGNLLISSNFKDNNNNVPARDSAKRRFLAFNLNNLTGSPGKPLVVKREYEIREDGVASKYSANDKITVYQEFGSCYAQDDGSAESGFGFNDDEFHADFTGAIAYKFNLVKADSLWAIGMFFNRSVTNSASIKFDLKVWQKISPLGQGRNNDVSLMTMKDLTPKFTDTINGYHVFVFDKALFLPKGDFFIGWEQEGNKHLDVGFDMNNGYHPDTEAGDNLFFTLLGSWNATNLKGALMMRPYVGKKLKLGPVKIADIKKQKIKCYPNPFIDNITVENIDGISKILCFDLSGKIIGESVSNEINTSLVQPGVYTLQITTQNGEIFHQKMVKLQY